MNRADLVYAICHLLGLRPGNERGAARVLTPRLSERSPMTESVTEFAKPKRRCAVSRPSAFSCSTAPWAP